MNTSEVLQCLSAEPLNVDGRLMAASNATLRCSTDSDVMCVYKPLRGERPLWDFPSGTLTGREIAAFHIDTALEFGLIPPTVWRNEGPAGPGMCQLWVAEDDDARLVDVVSPEAIPDGWLSVIRANDGAGHPVVLAHADHERLAHMAVLDAVLNNGDRKGGHVITDCDGSIWGVDHGVALSVEPKLRTVLWGWAGSDLPDDSVERLMTLRERIDSGFVELDAWLSATEIYALRARVQTLIESRQFPIPNDDWPAIPWPVF